MCAPHWLIWIALFGAATCVTRPLTAGARQEVAESDVAPNPAADVAAELRRLVDPDPRAREAARVSLNTLPAERLGELEHAVRQWTDERPSGPALGPTLKPIVRQVYTSGRLRPTPEQRPRTAFADDFGGFLGVTLRDELAARLMRNDRLVSPDRVDAPAPTGTLIGVRLVGFAGAVALHDGELILAARTLSGPDLTPLSHSGELQAFVRGQPEGTAVRLFTLRAARVVPIEVTLGARVPNLGDGANLSPKLAAIRADAEIYWRERFEPLIGR